MVQRRPTGGPSPRRARSAAGPGPPGWQQRRTHAGGGRRSGRAAPRRACWACGGRGEAWQASWFAACGGTTAASTATLAAWRRSRALPQPPPHMAPPMVRLSRWGEASARRQAVHAAAALSISRSSSGASCAGSPPPGPWRPWAAAPGGVQRRDAAHRRAGPPSPAGRGEAPQWTPWRCSGAAGRAAAAAAGGEPATGWQERRTSQEGSASQPASQQPWTPAAEPRRGQACCSGWRPTERGRCSPGLHMTHLSSGMHHNTGSEAEEAAGLRHGHAVWRALAARLLSTKQRLTVGWVLLQRQIQHVQGTRQRHCLPLAKR